ncbi:MAG: DNA-directed RNA polymerase subunit beta, partial [Patescibacteria group bacterium]
MMTKKSFAKLKDSVLPLPNLVKMHTDSYQWLITEGLAELFKEFSPISDYSQKKFTLEFSGFSLEETKHNEFSARAKNITLDAQLKVRLKLTNKEINQTKEQEIFFADFPIMTDRGTFIINGVERVVVPQLARSFGVQFNASLIKGKRYFSSKIIPSRGIWIEIETEADGVLYARIDNKRKIPISSILRIFGLKSDAEIEKAFAGIDIGQVPFIKKTLEKDIAKTTETSYVELYKRLRPGEPTDMLGFENSKAYVDGIFDRERYDLSLIGRYKLNNRLGKPTDNVRAESRTITLEDLIGIISKVIELNNNPLAQPDDIDHLGNRRIRCVGELLQQRLRASMAKIKRNIQDRMSTADPATLVPSQIVNNRAFMSAVRDFFLTNQLSQFMSQKNTLDEMEHLRRLSALGQGGLTRERAGFEVRDVHSSHYGRICPIQTPEGPNIGLVVHLAVYARINEFGFLETPYRKVTNGKVTNDILYLNALDESKYNIAHSEVRYDQKTGEILDEEVEARVMSQPDIVAKKDVHFMDMTPNQAYSVATSMIPFLDHDDATRALMGSNMQKQGVPCILPEAPLVGTGMEDRAARDVG